MRRSNKSQRQRRNLRRFLFRGPEHLERRDLLATFVVNSTADIPDAFPFDGICDTANDPLTDPPTPPSGVCTLRAAAQQAVRSDGPHRLHFSIPGSAIPVIDYPEGIGFPGSIDGSTQPVTGRVKILSAISASVNDGEVRNIDSLDRVVVHGNDNLIQGVTANRLLINGDGNTVGGSDESEGVTTFVELTIAGDENVVQGSLIGFNTESGMPEPATVTVDGVGNRIGGAETGQGNVIHGEVRLVGTLPLTGAANLVQGNQIGFTSAGVAPGSAGSVGVFIANMSGNRIGGSLAGERNVIAGFHSAIVISDGAHDNLIQNNLLGTNLAGDALGHPMQFIGVSIVGGGNAATAPRNNLIGGIPATEGNVISGFQLAGVRIFNRSSANRVEGNLIGLNEAGTDAIPNGDGVVITHAPNNLIGGPAGNVISGNTRGVVIEGSTATENQVLGNRIGTNAAGTVAIGNRVGVLVNDAPQTMVGGPLPGSSEIRGNLISGGIPGTGTILLGHGIHIVNPNAAGTVVQGNRIGTNLAGTASLANSGDGILVSLTSNIQIGGLSPTERNVISGNSGDGVTAFSTTATPVTDLVIEGNYIGTTVGGDAALPNGGQGVHLDLFTTGARVGGDAPGARNVISGNKLNGILINGESATDNEIYGNFIGTDVTGIEEVPNELHGIRILGAPKTIVGKKVGTSHVPNVISGNLRHGLSIEGPTATETIVEGNLIGVDVTGTAQLSNRNSGVAITNASGNRIGPYAAASPLAIPPGANILSDNIDHGVLITGAQATGNQVLGNGIGTDLNGAIDRRSHVLGNLGNGVLIIGGSNNFIGGQPTVSIPATASIPEQLAANVIAGNLLDGVRIEEATATGNRILKNSIYKNGSEGIDLLPIGITDNDLGGPEIPPDGDDGPNRLQNYPSISTLEALPNGTMLRLNATLASTPSTTFTIQVFSNADKVPAGQGERFEGQTTVTTNAMGSVEFPVDVPKPVLRGGRFNAFFSMTATDLNGNTSEFSPSATAPELVIEGLEFTTNKIRYDGSTFVFRDQITVSNLGGRDVTGALLQFRDQAGNPLGEIDQDRFVDLDSGEVKQFDVEWDVTDFIFGGNGVANLSISATIDPTNQFQELDEANNEQVASLTIDIRPTIAADAVHAEYLPGVFLTGVDLMANFIVDVVDWNGNLPGTDYSVPLLKTLELLGTTVEKEILILGSANPPFAFEVNLGEELPLGTTPLRLVATIFTDLQSTPHELSYTRINNPAWIGASVVTVSDDGAGPFDKVAVYRAGFAFPELATEGFFQIPVTANIGAGLLGPSIGPYSLSLDVRSDGAATLTGSGPWSGKVAGRTIFPEVNVLISGTAASDGQELRITELSTTVTLEGEIETPKVPLPPPVSFLSAHGAFTGQLSATLSAAVGPDGTLDFQPAGFGVEVGAGLYLSAGFEGIAYVQGGIGGTIAASFLLPGEPCILDALTLQFNLSAEVQFLIFSKEFEFAFPDPPIMLAGCGGASSEPAPAQGEDDPPPVTFTPSTAGPHFLTLTDAGLPDIRYAYAAPAIAHHTDGSKTLIWVDEDPDKLASGRLEIVGSRFENGAWSTPVPLTDDALLDFQPTITALTDGRALAVWTHATAVADPIVPDPTTLLESFELRYAIFDPATDSWSAPMILAVAGMDFLPQIVPHEGTAELVYFHDPDGSTFLFPQDVATVDHQLFSRTFDGAIWSNPILLLDDVTSHVAPQVLVGALGAGIDAIAVLAEPLLTTQSGLRTAVRRSGVWEPRLLLADEAAPVSPQLTTLPEGGVGIAWLRRQVADANDPDTRNDQLVWAEFRDGSLSAPRVLHQAAGISEPVLYTDPSGQVAVSWLESVADDVSVAYLVRDVNGTFGVSQQLASTPDQVPWWLLSWLDEGQLRVLHLSRSVTTAPEGGGSGEDELGRRPRFTGSSLALTTSTVAADLVVESLVLVTSPTPGESLSLEATVANRGDVASPASTIVLRADGATVQTVAIPALQPGQSQVIPLSFAVPPIPLAPIALQAIVDPTNQTGERLESNNQEQTTILTPDLQVQHVRATLDETLDRITVEATIRSIGPTATTVTIPAQLVLRTSTGTTVLQSIDIPPLASGEERVVMFTIDQARGTLTQARVGWVQVGASGESSSTAGDNQTAVFLTPHASWTNPVRRNDIDDSGNVFSNDALILINLLNRRGIHNLPFPPTPKPFYDPSGDNRLTPLDALLVINELNRASPEPTLANINPHDQWFAWLADHEDEVIEEEHRAIAGIV
jgi:hypothetical protein